MRIPLKINLKILNCLISALFITAISVPNLAISDDTLAPLTYRVPKECIPYVEYVEKYNWDTTTVIQLMYKESKCNPTAVNTKDNHRVCMGSYNLLQVACIHYKEGQDKKDIKTNIRLAYEVYQKAGNKFKPWTTCKLVRGCI